MSAWITHIDVYFNDESIKQYHIDTRDFHCSTDRKEKKEPFNTSLLKKYESTFIHTAEEVKELIQRYFDQSGGKMKWRHFDIEGESGATAGWNMKYIRIYRTKLGLVVCNRNSYILNKDILKEKAFNYIDKHFKKKL